MADLPITQDRQVLPLILHAMKDHLVSSLVTNQLPEDPIYFDVVKIGRWQDDPKRKNVHLAISGGDAEDFKYMDGIATLDDLDDLGFYVPAREFGGGQSWWRRGTIQIGCYFIRERYEEEVAVEYAYAALGRLMAEVENVDVTNLEDDFGERAIRIFLYGNSFFQSGGPPRSYIFRGKLLWACLTERP